MREHPLYHTAKARLEKRSGHHDAAIELLGGALELRAFSSIANGGGEQAFYNIFASIFSRSEVL